jgi:hypothetical protein
MDFEIRYPRLEEALRSLLPRVTGWSCSHRMLATRSIRENPSDAGKQRSRAFAQEVAALTDKIQASGRIDAILVTKRVDGVYVCLYGHHRLHRFTSG